MSTSARCCRLKQCLQEQCYVDRSHVEATAILSFVDRSNVVVIEAILEVVRVEKGKMLSTEAMSTGAVFCRQEPC